VKLSLPDKHPRSRYAFLTFDTVGHMKEFMSLGVIKKGNRQLIFKNYTSRKDKNGSRKRNTRLFVHNLPDFWEDSDLRNLFEQYGKTESAYIIMDRETGMSKCFGYVEMEDTHTALSIAETGYLSNDHYQVKVKIHQKTEKGKGRNANRNKNHNLAKNIRNSPYSHKRQKNFQSSRGSRNTLKSSKYSGN
jgi:RNA recognition motif-containing protein